MPTRYVSNADGKGWLTVKFKNNSTYPPLSQFLKVGYKTTKDKRDYFIILEGRNTGRHASVSLKENGASFLIAASPVYLYLINSRKADGSSVGVIEIINSKKEADKNEP